MSTSEPILVAGGTGYVWADGSFRACGPAAKGCGTAYYLIHSLECRLKSHTAFGGVGKMLSSLHWLRRR